MQTDNYGRLILSEEEICDLYLSSPQRIQKFFLAKEIISLPEYILTDVPKIQSYEYVNCPLDEFDNQQQKNYYMPERYKDLDIAEYILGLCKTETELQRVGTELLMYQDRDMFDFLKYLKYLVDIMRNNNIVWGVGRGSSVASYVLFLLGVHKINSIYYDLSIDEFLK
jgi:DNA polymerase III alpha subunit